MTEAVVLFEYEKQQEDELTLKVGEVILDVKQVDDGWCEGMLNGVRGMFPDNFVQLRQPTANKPPPPAPVPVAAPPEQLPNISRESKKARRAKVTYSYVAENPDELNLQPGQVVEVVEEEEEGWWRGRMDGKEGLFPSNFVEMMENGDKNAPSGPPDTTPPPKEKPRISNSDSSSSVIIRKRHSKPAPPPDPPAEDSSYSVLTTDGGRTADPPPLAGPPGMRQSILGPKIMPSFNPAEARSKLKKSAPAPPPSKTSTDRRMSGSALKKPAPPPTVIKPPEKPPSKPPEKQVERARVLFDYAAEQPDELTIKVGEVLEVVSKDLDGQEGWWEVRKGDQTGLIPDNFVEILPQSQPPPDTKPPPPTLGNKTEPSRSSPAKVPLKKPAKPPPSKPSEPPHEPDTNDFGVPNTAPLDSSAVKSRPKKPVSRPPSRSNLHQEPEKPPEEVLNVDDQGSKLSPWQQEMKARKAKVPVPPKAGKKPPPAVKPAAPAVKALPAEPESKPKPTHTPVKPQLPKPAEGRAMSPSTQPTIPPGEKEHVSSNAWKEAFDKLKADFDSFKKECRRELQILTDDLDKERKIRAELQIDIDRLKKAREFRDNL